MEARWLKLSLDMMMVLICKKRLLEELAMSDCPVCGSVSTFIVTVVHDLRALLRASLHQDLTLVSRKSSHCL